MIGIDALLLLGGSGGALTGGIVALRRHDQRRRDAGRAEFTLRFPRDLTATQAAEALAQIVPGHDRAYRGVRGVDATVLEVEATAESIVHRLLVPERHADGIASHLHAALPGLGLERVTPPAVAVPWTLATALRLAEWHRPLRTNDSVAVSRAVLASLRPLRAGERVVVQWQLLSAPSGAPARRRTTTKKPVNPFSLANHAVQQLDDPEDMRAARAKQSAALYWATLRIGAVAAHRERARHLVSRAAAAVSMTAAPGVQLSRRRMVRAHVAATLARRATPLAAWPILANRDELVGLIGWPLASPVVPGLALTQGRKLAPAAAMALTGRVIGNANYPGQERALAQTAASVLLHTWIVGPTGSGKSHLLANLIVQDMASGRSVVVIDAKADLVETVLERVPAYRERDVIVIDAASDRPVGVNPLASSAQPIEVVADQLYGVLVRLWDLKAAPRTSDLLHAAILTLAHEPGMTLVELLPLLTNPAFRRRVTARHALDPVLGSFWAGFDGLSEGERAQVIAPTLTRLRQFLLRSSLRAMLGQAEPAFSMGEAIETGKIVLVSLAAGRIGSESAALLGAIVMAELWLATQARASLAPERRRLVSAYVDEFQLVSHLPTDLADVLAQSRGYGVGYTLANQSPTQLPSALREAVSTNCRTKIAFASSANDAASLARDLGPDVTADDVQGLGRFEVLAAIATGAGAASSVTAVTAALPEPTGRADKLRALSAARWGCDRSEVEAATRERLGVSAEAGAPSRKRRAL